jgi:hypothetical protein
VAISCRAADFMTGDYIVAGLACFGLALMLVALVVGVLF